jgi:hypothetical protein
MLATRGKVTGFLFLQDGKDLPTLLILLRVRASGVERAS